MFYLTIEELIPIKSYPQHYTLRHKIFRAKKYNTIINKIIAIIEKRYNYIPEYDFISNKLFRYGYISINHYRFDI